MTTSLHLLALGFTLLLLGETHATSTSGAVAACETRCSVRAEFCRETKHKILSDCTSLDTCHQPTCMRDYKCSFGCAVCENQLKYHLAECDSQLNACTTDCSVIEDATAR
jgi:hypothetical protein